ncbi:Gfo/Idh/MocA family protein [Pseudobutyrivibrio sp.]|uniref:Gfo/Idh/MocA family protein n=1 Tax=Pseudobutyrivibrio sp. TaxID=2014367 RepID=UPI00386C9806
MSKHYDIAFVGLGSIGTRHLNNARTFLDERGDTYAIDLYRHKLQDSLPDDVRAQYLYGEELQKTQQYDIVFVTNPTSMHEEAVYKFIGHARAFFIEKPVFGTTDVNEVLLSQLDAVPNYVACPLRYNPVLQYVHEFGLCKDAIAVRAICSSYLPEWRPNTDYRNCYSAHRDMGGGVGIDLIHEWDYLTWLLGMPEECHSIQTKISNLEIDSDDIAIYIAKTKNTSIEVHLDYFGRKPIRQLEIFLPEGTIRCDLIQGSITYLKSGKQLELDAERNAFQMKEIAHFFDIVDGRIASDSDVRHAMNVLRIAKGEYK